MKTILDEFELKTIELWVNDRIKKQPAWCYGELYATQIQHTDSGERWQIGCIPVGGTFPTALGFPKNLEMACQVMKELARINNCWSLTKDFSKKQMEQLRATGKKFGNDQRSEPFGNTNLPDHAQPNLNGASVETYH